MDDVRSLALLINGVVGNSLKNPRQKIVDLGVSVYVM